MIEKDFREEILPLVEKPGRYVGGEVHASRRGPSPDTLNVVLAFPDTYEVGMSHLGLQILYGLLLDDPAVVPERTFAPWPDMEREMRKRGLPLTSLESGTPLARFDLVGFSLQYELSYTNVLNMLDLGGIPLFSEERGEKDPIVLAGGPAAFNPLPMAPFVDAFAVGEGEEVLLEIAALLGKGKKGKWGREERLRLLAEIEGVYVPRFHGREKRIRRRVLADPGAWTGPRRPVVPLIQAVHDRVTLEIARGCTRGCRFCQAGMVWRPVRERPAATLLDMAESMIGAVGGDEISLLSLSSGDYSCIGGLMKALMARYSGRKVALALPSMRVETLTDELIGEIRKVRKTSFTLAPEAGTQRLRDVINKGNREEDLLRTAKAVFNAGWRSLKLYFMIGLPTETERDLEGIADLARRVAREGGFRRQVTVSLSTFVPKPHTPFQWCAQLSPAEIRERQEFFREKLRHRSLGLKWHDAWMSLLEGVFSRGDESLAPLVHEAFRAGCRMDGWGDMFSREAWEKAMERAGIVPERMLGGIDGDAPLPWEFIDAVVERPFLRREYEKALLGEGTEDCRTGPCTRCGACTKDLKTLLEESAPVLPGAAETPEAEGVETNPKRYRLRFGKRGGGRFLSHLETVTALVRALKRSGCSFRFSEGFHPQPKISLASATPVGMESHCEFADLFLREPLPEAGDFLRAVDEALPEGLFMISVDEIPSVAPSLSSWIAGYVYAVRLPSSCGLSPEAADGRISDFLARETLIHRKERKGKVREQDLRSPVHRLSRNGTGETVEMEIRFRDGGSMNPLDIVTAVFGLEGEAARAVRIVKKEPVVLREERTP
jgi:radical SAM family uncharacterized protein/radical SAM-linked protein